MGRRWARLRGRLVRRMSGAGPVGGILAALLSLGRARNWDCEDVFRETALAVGGVVSAEFDCSDMFGGGWRHPGHHGRVPSYPSSSMTEAP